MFTGLIEEIGKISAKRAISGGLTIKVGASLILNDLKVDDSVAVNGVCLTATKVEPDGFWADAVGETLTKTTIKNLTEGSYVNLERALQLSDRLGGHIVQGHCNGIAKIRQITKRGDNYFLEIVLPVELEKYVIKEGSISIDGISLTIAQLENSKVGLSIIPHTWNKTNLVNKQVGEEVNIEVDLIAKYVEKLLFNNSGKSNGKYSDEWFKNLGYE